MEIRKFKRKPNLIEAMNFTEFKEFIIQEGANLVDDVPWSCKIGEYHVTHENDDLYFITSLNDEFIMDRSKMLIMEGANIRTMDLRKFDEEYLPHYKNQ